MWSAVECLAASTTAWYMQHQKGTFFCRKLQRMCPGWLNLVLVATACLLLIKHCTNSRIQEYIHL